MKTSFTNTPTEARKNVLFSNFRYSKRVCWTAKRNYSY